MNKAQKVVIVVVLVAVAIMCIVPPWQSRASSWSRLNRSPGGGSQGIGTAGYAFIFMPPDYARGIDVARLAFQLIALLALGGTAFAIVHVLRSRARGRQ